MSYKNIFGPVHSRRLGISLGVDVIPYKYCPLNCVYCEVLRTNHLTIHRQEFFPPEEILSKVREVLATNPELDYVTFSGAGEPTLYSKLGEVILRIKEEFPQYKLAILTNGVLLNHPSVRKEILPLDLILPSLDTCNPETFKKINRPHPSIKVSDLISGLIALRKEYSGPIWLEIFIIAGLNDSEEELESLSKAINRIQPDKVQLNSLDRPGAEFWVKPAGTRVLREVQRFLSERVDVPVEIIARIPSDKDELMIPPEIEGIIAKIINDHPSTVEEIAKASELHINEVSHYLRQLHLEHKINIKPSEKGPLFVWKKS
ncbi:MAG: radical SAM protein [Candidatus Cloacimonadaceae bacterium]|jgi:wyosine [tRNA(Phe)-imidazoG37] synthetase (radical SAM superfamily)|nr:radical SAM protein [Candidatus Cloacimonadota bacterium]MDY0112074.1 radical SAM protein [Candidatus Syntrophosphaera sp.]